MSAKKKSRSLQNASESEILISVVIPVYNVEKYLAEAIESVLNQNPEKIEVVAINDGSDDGSGNLLDEYAKKDSRIRVIHQENRGLSAVRNRGLKIAKGKYIYFFDSDDVLKSNALETVLARLETTKSDIACFSVNLIDESGCLRTKRNKNVAKGLEISEPVKGEKFLQMIFHSGKYGAIVQKYVFLKVFLEEYALLFDEGYIHEDEAFTMEALSLAGNVVSFEEAFLLKRTRPGSIMSNLRSEKNIEGWLQAASRLLNFVERRNLSELTKSIIHKKASQLILISLYNIQRINRRSELNLSLYDYIEPIELRKLGFVFNLKIRFNMIYKAYHKIKSLLSLKRD